MADFVCVSGSDFPGVGYRIQHYADDGNPGEFLHTKKAKGIDGAVFAAFISTSGMPAGLPLSFEGKGLKLIKAGKLSLAVVRSQLEIYKQPARSGSEDSQALYLGHFLNESLDIGILLQYLEAGAHTSVHSHPESESYVPVYGSASAFLLREGAYSAEKASESLLGSGNGKVSMLSVPGKYHHPLQAREDSLTLIVANAKTVKDQVNGTRSNHNHAMLFAEFYRLFVNRA
ncbi:hypothetical protein HYU40_04980 [Candidatus Woesearchaeota archaeon]|nr:hypothetical protein [Candidatus Woesearchaeota archaeon]